ncbi:MAG: hypothetical protein U0990_09980 [Candidatus Nanopelagicales bacterium]|nr:hypothetical protein [Candidatus Nanopelagicales bacterium]
MKKPNGVKRVVLGVGYPWFSSLSNTVHYYDSVQLTARPVAASILLRGGEQTVSLHQKGVGNWNKVRLVLEVLE